MKNINLFIIAFLSLLSTKALSQNFLHGITTTEVNMPESPEVSAFMKFVEIPVDLYTGIPQISVPLFTISEPHISHSTSISYHSGGHKVSEMATKVGLGWKLNAGGMITRKLNGHPDDLETWGYFDYTASNTKSAVLQHHTDEDYNDCVDQVKCVDTEPDVFHFNVNGISGSFAFPWGSTTPTVSSNFPVSVNVIFDDHKIDTIKLTGPDGAEYLFTIHETTYNSEWECPPKNYLYTSAWYLSKISHPNFSNEEITFFYGDTATITRDYLRIENILINRSQQYYQGEELCGNLSSQQSANVKNQVTIKTPILDSISTNLTGFTIEFVEGSTRADTNGIMTYTNFNSLDKVKLNGGGSFIKEMDLSHDYSTNRLTLTSIQEKSGSDSKPSYTFEYNATDLPDIDSGSVDHWGFYNNSTESLLPSYHWVYDTILYFIPKSDKTPKLQYTEAGILEEITYPTGGEATLTYELNDYSYINGTSLDSLDIIGYEYLSDTCEVSYGGTKLCTKDITTNVENTAILVELDAVSSCDSANWNTCVPIFEIRDSNNNAIASAYDDYGPGGSQYSTLSLVFNVVLEDIGDYTLHCEIQDSTVQNSLDVKIYYAKKISDKVKDNVGGLRIKKTELDDKQGQVMTKDYNYEDDVSGWSSGVIYGFPEYFEYRTRLVGFYDGGCVLDCKDCDYINIAGSNRVITGATQGNHIGYSKASVRENGASSNWRTDTYFTSPIEYPDHINNYLPYQGPIENGFKTGLKKKILYYNDKGQLVKKDTFAHESLKFDFDAVKYSFGILDSPDPDAPSETNEACAWVEYGDYCDSTFIFDDKFRYSQDNVRIGHAVDYLIEETYYFSNGNVVVLYDKTYDSSLQNVTSEEITNSDGMTYRTNYIYSGCTFMKGVPSKIEQYRSTGDTTQQGFPEFKLIGGQRVSTKSFSGDCLPEKIEEVRGGEWVLKGTFKSYNANNLPTSFERKNYTDLDSFSWNVEKLAKKSYKDFDWEYEYDASTRQMTRFTDVDKQALDYTYDKIGRLTEISERAGDLKTSFSYDYSIPGTNKVQTTIDYKVDSDRITENYFDGLGRPFKSIKVAYTPTSHNYISISKYDNYGRLVSACEPSAGGCTNFTFETSPLERLTYSQFENWPKSINMEYETNSSAISIGGNTYSAKTLFVVKTTDENKNITKVYSDKVGKKILERKMDFATNIDTKYEYNDLEQLVKVHPPAGDAYIYEYDSIGLLVKKTLPDSIVTEYEYDVKERIHKTTLPMGEVLENVYDDYDRITSVKLDNTTITTSTYHSTGIGKISRLDEQKDYILSNTSNSVVTDFDYDSLGRVSSKNITTYNSGSDNFSYEYTDYDMVKSETRHFNDSGITDTIVTSTTYDHSGRVSTNSFKIENNTSVVSRLYYGENDWLRQRVLGNCLQVVDYDYNMRGWLFAINGYYAKYVFGEDYASFSSETGGYYNSEMTVLYNSQELNDTVPTIIQIQYIANQFNSGDTLLVTDTISFPVYITGAVGSTIFTDTLDYTITGLLEDESYMAGVVIDDIAEVVCARQGASCNPSLDGHPNKDLWETELNKELDTKVTPNDDPPRDPTYGGECSPDIFRQIMYYEKGNSTIEADPQYNGNISWIQRIYPIGDTIGADEYQEFGFNYDDLDRLKKSTNGADRYSSVYSYDNLGNIQDITRDGKFHNGTEWTFGQIDDLDFIYSGNKLTSITEYSKDKYGFIGTGGSYNYDEAGNMIKTPQLDSIIYNHLNLPDNIKVEDSIELDFVYDASGYKWQKEVKNPDKTSDEYVFDYISGVELLTPDGGSVERKAVQHLEGRYIDFDTVGWTLEYTLRDHLGNSRISFIDADGDDSLSLDENLFEVVQIQDYYSFGMNMDLENSIQDSDNKYLYNGKELNVDFDLNWMDYGARWYDGSIGRFNGIDLLASKYSFQSPYVYAVNNPIKFIDYMGLGPMTDYYDTDGNLLLSTDDGSNNVVLVGSAASGCFSCFVDFLNNNLGLGVNSKQFSDKLTKLLDGTEYDVDAFSAFFDSNEGDIETQREDGIPTHVDAEGNPVEVANEHATFLYKGDDGVITTGPENIQGISSYYIPSDKLKPSKDGSVGTLHTHPAQGKGLSYLTESEPLKYGTSYSQNKNEGIPSLFDRTYHAPQGGGYSVFTTKTEHVFFNKTGNFFSVPRKK